LSADDQRVVRWTIWRAKTGHDGDGRLRPQGFGSRWRKGSARNRARNVAELQDQLEGPGSERRLAQIQRRFRVLDKQARRKAAVGLAMLGMGVFLAVVAIGLVSTYGLPLFEAGLAALGRD
jgi:hypothetical protein